MGDFMRGFAQGFSGNKIADTVTTGLKEKKKKREGMQALDALYKGSSDDVKDEAKGKYDKLYKVASESDDPVSTFTTGLAVMKEMEKETPEEKRYADLEKSAVGKGVDVTALDLKGKSEDEKKSALAKAIKETEGGADAPEMLRIASTLRKEFNDRVSDFDSVRRSYTLMQKAMDYASKTDNYIAVDQALVMLFNKMLDPRSVVRESEFARTPENAPVLAHLQGKIQQISKGGVALTNREREELVNVAKELLSSTQDYYLLQRENYSNIAKEYKVPDSRIIGQDLSIDFGEKEPTAVTPDGTTWKAGDTYMGLPVQIDENGRAYVDDPNYKETK